MSLNLTQIRQDTPATESLIHFNNAGAALMPVPVVEALRRYLDLETRIGGYEAAAHERAAVRQFYAQVARLIGAGPGQIAYTTSATDAYNKALSSIPFERGDVVLTTRYDYASNQIAFLQMSRRFGVEVVRAESGPDGGVDIDDLTRRVRKRRPKLVAVTHVPTNNGLVQDVEAIGRVCRENDIWYVVDACQSVGQLPLDVEAIGCDFLSATGRKFLRGPRGTGFLYVSDRVLRAGLEPLFLDLYSAHWTAADQYEPLGNAKRFELWERNYGNVVGVAVAAEYALGIGLEAIAQRTVALTTQLRRRLENLDRVTVLERGPQRTGILTCTVAGVDPKAFLTRLREAGLNAAASPNNIDPLNFGARDIDWALRLSPHYYNTEEEVERAVAILEEKIG